MHKYTYKYIKIQLFTYRYYTLLIFTLRFNNEHS
ncbi:hypothetical protein Echvi_4375 [Echinicola vietnamensis DSM 17526]|uniref:Uncharacterized protein n=1 Tax=Echinicola vietnamensis (strain DSM 17526 / LMG 23754 / KMM 6221) TaxID=926556 RepID=L0G2Y0_ECHVK|nr:hypothetical protein Echvi_4375 [Echinicola vietnamensis DSM 17526]